MATKKATKRHLPSLTRTIATKNLSTVHWFFCEGKTEKDCIDKLRQRNRIASVTVEVVGPVGVPKSIVAKAAAKQKELQQTRQDKHPTIIHVVFDRDEHPCFPGAVNRARTLGMSLGVSVPCIELWAILLHQDQTAWIHRHEAQRLLKRIHPNYCHKTHAVFDIDVVATNRMSAATRAAKLATRAVDSGREFANPSTTFHEVLEKIFGKD